MLPTIQDALAQLRAEAVDLKLQKVLEIQTSRMRAAPLQSPHLERKDTKGPTVHMRLILTKINENPNRRWPRHRPSSSRQASAAAAVAEALRPPGQTVDPSQHGQVYKNTHTHMQAVHAYTCGEIPDESCTPASTNLHTYYEYDILTYLHYGKAYAHACMPK